jgi:hypothetical protein
MHFLCWEGRHACLAGMIRLKLVFLVVSGVVSLLGLSRREAWWTGAEILMLRRQLAVASVRGRMRARLTWPDRAWLALLAGTVPAGRLAGMPLRHPLARMIRSTVHLATRTPCRRRCPHALTAPYKDSGARRPSRPGSNIPASIVVTAATAAAFSWPSRSSGRSRGLPGQGPADRHDPEPVPESAGELADQPCRGSCTRAKNPSPPTGSRSPAPSRPATAVIAAYSLG